MAKLLDCSNRENPEPSFRLLHTLLCVQDVSRISAMLLYKYILEDYGYEYRRDSFSKLGLDNMELLEGMIVFYAQSGDHYSYYLWTGDREQCITESFLKECDPQHADNIRATINKIKQKNNIEVKL